jgi:hypothetical protein
MEFLSDPYRSIDGIFYETAINGDPNMELFRTQTNNFFKKILENDEALSRIPFLDKNLFQSGKLVPNTLVRVRGMVQDILNPEFFVAAYMKPGEQLGIF